MGKKEKQMNEAYIKIVKFVNCVADLSAYLEQDIKNDKQISSRSVVALSKTISAMNAIAELIDQAEAANSAAGKGNKLQ